MQNKKVPLIAAGVIVLLLLFATVAILSSTKNKTVTDSQGTNPAASGTPVQLDANGKTYMYKGTNGRKSFNFEYPSTWTVRNLTSTHQAMWLELTKGKSIININQEPTMGEVCLYPGEPEPEVNPKNDAVGHYGKFKTVRTKSGVTMRVAAQKDYEATQYACEDSASLDGSHFGQLTHVGIVTLSTPIPDGTATEDFVKILSSLETN